jgi:MOB kinase activator 1
MPSSTGTFQPLRHRSGTMRDRLHAYTKRTLGAGGSLNQAVALPPGESCAGWVAVHAIDFYNDVCTIWAVMATDPYLNSFRPGEGFPSGVEYRWSDGGEAVSVSAPVYIEKVLEWIAEQMNDETKFPDDDDEAEALKVFQTPQFAALCGQIFRRLFRVYGIIYSSFFGTLEALDMAAALNSCFKHFMFFCTEFGLLPEREIEPLEVIVKPIRKQYFAGKQGGDVSNRS